MPPGRAAFSNTVTSKPARLSTSAAASPAGPEPTTATRSGSGADRRLGPDIAALEALLDDGQLDLADVHRPAV